MDQLLRMKKALPDELLTGKKKAFISWFSRNSDRILQKSFFSQLTQDNIINIKSTHINDIEKKI